MVRHAGGYTDYRRARDAMSAETARRENDEKSPEPKERRRERKGLTYGEEIELREIMAKIEAAEAEVARLEAELADPALYAERGAEVPALGEALEAARGLVEELLARWEELEAKKDA